MPRSIKEGTIKIVSLGNKKIEHIRRRNVLGFLIDIFEIIEEKGGIIIHTPILPPIKANNYTKETSIGNEVNDYTAEEMLDILKEFNA